MVITLSFNDEAVILKGTGCPLCIMRVEDPENTRPCSRFSAVLCCFSTAISSTAAVAEPPAAAYLAMEAMEGFTGAQSLGAHSATAMEKPDNDDEFDFDFDFDCDIACDSCCIAGLLCCYGEPPGEPPAAAYLAMEAMEGFTGAQSSGAHSATAMEKVDNDDEFDFDFDFDCDIACDSCCVAGLLCCYGEPPGQPQQQVML